MAASLKALVRRETYAPALEKRFRFLWLLYLIVYIIIAAVIVIMVQFNYIFIIYCVVAAIVPPILIIYYCYKTEKREDEEYQATIQAHLDGNDEDGMRKRCRKWVKHNSRKVDGAEPSLTGRVCAICLGDYTAGDRVWILPCGHAYHKECIDVMLKECKPEHGKIFRCPICRVQLGIEDLHTTNQHHNNTEGQHHDDTITNRAVAPPAHTNDMVPVVVNCGRRNGKHTNIIHHSHTECALDEDKALKIEGFSNSSRGRRCRSHTGCIAAIERGGRISVL